MDPVSTLSDELANFLEANLSGILAFKGASYVKTAVVDYKDERVEENFVRRIEGAVDKNTAARGTMSNRHERSLFHRGDKRGFA
jgi:hypothetical protein